MIGNRAGYPSSVNILRRQITYKFIVEYGKFEVIDGKVEYQSDDDHEEAYSEEFTGVLTAQYINGAWTTSAVANQPKSKS